jgi:polysaccharide biosynthesis transport protein
MAEHVYPVAEISRAVRLGRDPSEDRSGALVDLAATRRFLARRWRLIAGVVLLCTVAAALVLALVPKTYTATAILIVDPRTQKVAQSDVVLGGIGSDAAAVESQVEILESSTLAKRVVAELGLDRGGELTEPSAIARATAGLRGLLGLSAADPSPAEQRERVLQRFSERLHVRRRGLTYVLEVAYSSGSAETAAQVANALSEAYLADQKRQKLEAARSASGMLGARLDELRARARDTERAVSTFKNQNDIVDLGAAQTLLDREIAEQSQQLTQARARGAEASARYAQARRATATGAEGGGTLAEALQSSVVTNLRQQYAQLGAQLADLRNNLGPRHPAVGAAEAQARTVAGQIRTEIGRLAQGLRNEAEAASARERTLSASLENLKGQAARRAQARVRLAELEREAQASKVILEQYLLRQKETSEQQNLVSSEARVLTQAAPPLRASAPQTGLLLVVALAGGVVLGLGAAALADAMEPGLRHPGAIERGLGVPVLGTLPRVAPDRTAPGGGREGGSGHARLIGDSREHARFDEAIRMLALPLHAGPGAQGPDRSGLDGRGIVGRSGDTLLVTSAVAGEGKSTVAEHLAAVFAGQGRKVLLVDLDARGARLTRSRRAGQSPGLLDALRNASDPGNFVHHGTVDAISFLPIGIARDDPTAAELFFSPALGRAVADLRRRFDLIVLDGPHLLNGIEGRLLLAHADRTALVVEWGRTSREDVSAALDLFARAPGSLAGIILNKVDRKALRRYG